MLLKIGILQDLKSSRRMAVRVTDSLRPSCPGGTSGWLLAASIHPPNGQSHKPLLLAVIDPSSGTVYDSRRRPSGRRLELL